MKRNISICKEHFMLHIRNLLLLCGIFLCWGTLTAKEPNLHICTVASHYKKGFEQLLVSCQQRGVEVDVLGYGQPFRSPSENVLHVQRYLEMLPEDDVVMFVDGYDVMILERTETILEKFLQLQAPFVISVERYCWPYPERIHEYPAGPTSFRYINSGSYIGYVSAVKDILGEMLAEAAPLKATDDEQGLFTLHYLRHPEKYTFDSYCKLFMPLAGVIEQEISINGISKTVRCLETSTRPCVVHGNGGSRPLYQLAYDCLFPAQPAAEETN
jgi:hypothetical protein